MGEFDRVSVTNTIIAAAAVTAVLVSIAALVVSICLVRTARETEERQLRAYLIPIPPTLVKQPKNAKTGRTQIGHWLEV
jgi:hypothetical protein